MIVAFAIAAVCLSPPVDGPVVERFAPVGEYSGHWGIDYSAEIGAGAQAPASGRVTFAGSVAGMMTVTIEPVPGLKVSLSYLSAVLVSTGDVVTRGELVAGAGSPHGVPGVHLSTRIDGRYVDPLIMMGCRDTDITRALRLVTPPPSYARRRANRNPRRDLRPDPYRPSAHCRVRTPSAPARQAAHRSRRRPLAEVGP